MIALLIYQFTINLHISENVSKRVTTPELGEKKGHKYHSMDYLMAAI